MTLLLTWMFPFGIVMGADSAMTVRNPETGHITEIRNNIQKIFEIPKIKAGISCWGNARVGDEELERWLPQFIEEHESDYHDIHDIAILLQNEIRKYTPPITAPEESSELRYGNRGFHLAGYTEFKGKLAPTFYHIHNGKSEFFTDIDPRIVNANNDRPPSLILDNWKNDTIPYTRNGDFFRFAQIFDSLFDAINKLKVNNQPLRFPEPSKFKDRLEAFSEFVRFWIRLTRDVYALSNAPEIIGGEIRTLTISPEGVMIFTSKK